MSNTVNLRTLPRRWKGVLVAVASVAVATPLVVAGVAQAADDFLLPDCLQGSTALQACTYNETGFTPDTLGAPQRVSTILDNCQTSVAVNKAFTWTARVSRSIENDTGKVATFGGSAEASIVQIGASHSTGTSRLVGGSEELSTSNTISGDVQPQKQGYIMFQQKGLQSVGFLHGVYKDAIDGRTEFDYPGPGGNGVKVLFPQMLQDGIPDGRVWLRNTDCGVTVENNQDLQTAGFGEIPGVQDIELKL